MSFLTHLIWQDLALAVGGFVGIVTKLYALLDPKTVWSRRSSGVNAAFFVPSLAAFASLGLLFTTLTTLISFFIWSGVYIWRAPEEEDWLGRKS